MKCFNTAEINCCFTDYSDFFHRRFPAGSPCLQDSSRPLGHSLCPALQLLLRVEDESYSSISSYSTFSNIFLPQRKKTFRPAFFISTLAILLHKIIHTAKSIIHSSGFTCVWYHGITTHLYNSLCVLLVVQKFKLILLFYVRMS